jgi:hypothetical protein
VKEMDKYCKPELPSQFSTYDEASKECSKLENCKHFVEKSSNSFLLCGSPAMFGTSSTGATLYTKKGK